MSKKIILIVIAIIVIAGIGYWIYQSTIEPKEITEQEQVCIDSGGEVRTSLCCKATSDFPNMCLIGPCGCSPDNSHEVKVCDCGPGKCFDGSKCVSSGDVLTLLEDLNQETGIDFSEIEDVEFKWIVKVDPETVEETVAGKGFEASMVTSEQFNSIRSFLTNRGFKRDTYNFASGTNSELTGYLKDKTACAVSGGFTGYKEAEGQWIPSDTDHWDIAVNCGNVEKTKMEYAIEESLQSSKSTRDICIEMRMSSEMCEKIPLQGFESFESYKAWCLEIGGLPEACEWFESNCRRMGSASADECFRAMSTF
jgi:hypothetical protein